MKNILLVAFLALTNAFVTSQSKKDIKNIQSAFKDMVLIPSGRTMTGALLTHPLPIAKDSNLLMDAEYCDGNFFKLTYDFYLCSHEVTNSEYKKFIAWVKDSTSKMGAMSTMYKYVNSEGQITVIDVMPDTMQWHYGPIKYIGDPMSEYYHNRLEFEAYPVVNVSQEQALAYIHWLNNRFSELLHSHRLNLSYWGAFRLPTAQKWQYAASYAGPEWLDENQTENRVFGWDSRSLKNSKESYLGNFGQIIDENGMLIKSMYDDGYQYTAPAISYAPSALGLYNMSGNVSEWTKTSISVDSLRHYYTNCYKIVFRDYPSLINEFLKENPDWTVFEKYARPKNAQFYNPRNDFENRDMSEIIYFMKPVKRAENHNMKTLSRQKNAVIVKGGSWADGPAYLQSAINQVFSKTNKSPKIGFRLALEMSSELKALLNSIK